jgi:hypothetical protein
VPPLAKPDVQAQLIEDMSQFECNPLGHVLYSYPWGEAGTELEGKNGPRAWQEKTLRLIGSRLTAMFKAGKSKKAAVAEAIRVARSSGHGIGKSALVAWIVKWALDTFEDTKVVVTANTEKQLLTKTWPELAKWHRLSMTAAWFTLTATSLYAADVEHEKTWRADAISWSENNTEAFAGLHNEGRRVVLVFDEASAIADKVWEVAEGALTDADTQIIWLAFGNPTRATGRFRECWRRFRHRWDTEEIDSRSVEGTNKVQLDQWVADYGEDSDFVKMRVRGIFPSASPKQFISETDVLAAYGKHLKPEQYQFAPKIISVDGSWEGDDLLVIGLRQGLFFQVLFTMPVNDNDVWVANTLARLEDQHKADAVFIDGGFGTGIVSVGRTLKRNWRLVWFGEAASDKGCVNKRAEMARDCRDWLKEGGALPEIPQLRDDLTAVETVARLDGKLQLESKKDMKARGIPSPNYGDSCWITFAYPVQSRARELVGVNAGSGLLSVEEIAW